jgi:2-keto-3-deoxy-L-rhamnonate aldolase RhmA
MREEIFVARTRARRVIWSLGLAVAAPEAHAVVRIPLEGDEVFKSTIKQLLDQGVMGIIVPHVRTREQATRLVEAITRRPSS